MNNLDNIYNKTEKIIINDNSKFVIMSDCHRGTGDNYDNFLKNKNIYDVALKHYLNNNFSYIELGDGDEMWEVNNYHDIINTYLDTFKYLKMFHEKKRLFMVYGNHDVVKKDKKILEEYFYTYYNESLKKQEVLFKNLKIYEALILSYKNKNIFLIHGHQVDFFNNKLWKMSRFLVKTLWRFLERVGISDPTSAAKNYLVRKNIERKLQKWSIKNNTILVAGHTHRPVFPQVGSSLYFNDGSCIHPNGITGIEIEDGCISLVKWEISSNSEGVIYTERKVLAEKEKIINFFTN